MSHSPQLKRTAKIFHLATGLPYQAVCLPLARRGVITRERPIPEARARAQQWLETQVLYALCDAFRDDDGLKGKVLGLSAIRPDEDNLVLVPAHALTARLVASILPIYDADYGGVWGCPGVRLRRVGRQLWRLADIVTGASVHVVVSGHEDPASVYRLEPKSRILWKTSPGRLTDVEEDTLRFWGSGLDHQRKERDRMLSSLMRRAMLLNAVGVTHGGANLYDHAHSDIVVEWCCGSSLSQLATKLQKSRLLARCDSSKGINGTAPDDLGSVTFRPLSHEIGWADKRPRIIVRRIDLGHPGGPREFLP
ncbi:MULTISPECIES: hypothetical protein [Nonomuraea]|uniref:Uncharacterized protein n=1 Tax=Nonomuraea africana TaxID=46171 RepID=A0ABR9KS96_9ACTN|nr:hypothetical protein [Nonomuraea africana]MBE1564600.1 hypothetical protein [Nonomuraea africana]